MIPSVRNYLLELVEVDVEIEKLNRKRETLAEYALRACRNKKSAIRLLIEDGKKLATISVANDGSDKVFSNVEVIDT